MYGNNADSRFSCKGCKHEWAVPSHERCIGCARMYLDHYEKGDSSNDKKIFEATVHYLKTGEILR